MYNLQRDKSKYFLLGKIIKTYGYKGEIVMYLDSDEPEAYADVDVVFINMEQSLVPWFINNISIKNDLATIKLDDLDEPEKAREYVGKEIYLPLDKLKGLQEEDFYFHEVIGFQAVDAKHGNIGEITEVLDRPEQEILRIIHKEKEILVPLSDEMITGVDKKGRILYLETPEGLIDLYLE